MVEKRKKGNHAMLKKGHIMTGEVKKNKGETNAKEEHKK